MLDQVALGWTLIISFAFKMLILLYFTDEIFVLFLLSYFMDNQLGLVLLLKCVLL